MGASCSLRIEADLGGGTGDFESAEFDGAFETTGINWSDLTPDTNAIDGLRLTYGITGNGPLDSVAGTGECSWTLRNSAGNSGAAQGLYSPNHANARSGWTYGVPVRMSFTDTGTDAALAITSITRASTTATVTTTAAHGYTTGQWVTMAGANEQEYLGVHQITVTGGSTFTCTVEDAPATPATGTITARRCYVKHRGKIRVIDPLPGAYATQTVGVVSYDGMRDLAETEARSVAIQIDKTETELVSAVLDALPSASQPVARDLDAGVDSYPYAFDDLEGGQLALGVIKKVADSAFALVAMKGDGTLILRNRHARATGTSLNTLNDTMHGLLVPTSLDQVFNLVRVTYHPKQISAAATDELYTLPTGAFIEIPAGETREVWTEYTDPDDRQTRVGGTAVVTALVGGTHYSAFSVSDGTGDNLTANITPTISAFASTAKWSFVSNAAVTAYVTLQKVIGKAVRDPGPQTVETTSTQSYGTRPLSVDMPYQDDSIIAESAALFIEAQRSSFTGQMDAVEFIANSSAALMTAALARERGDRITVTETVTGLTTADAIIQSVSLTVEPGPWLHCRWGLTPVSPWTFWQIGTVGVSELGTTTILGF